MIILIFVLELYQNAKFSYNIVFLKLSVKNCEGMWKSVAFFKITIVKMSLIFKLLFLSLLKHKMYYSLIYACMRRYWTDKTFFEFHLLRFDLKHFVFIFKQLMMFYATMIVVFYFFINRWIVNWNFHLVTLSEMNI